MNKSLRNNTPDDPCDDWSKDLDKLWYGVR